MKNPSVEKYFLESKEKRLEDCKSDKK